MAGELTDEQVLEQLLTRGLDSGGPRTPLRWFRGRLTAIKGSMVQRGNMTQPKLEIIYKFNEVEVKESIEPYPFPVADIPIMHSRKAKSNMGVLATSIDKIINAGVAETVPQSEVKNQGFLLNKMQEWKLTPGHMMWDAAQLKETPRDCWEVVMVEGCGGTPTTTTTTKAESISPSQHAINILDGKTLTQFNQYVLQDQLIKEKGGQLIVAIANGSFVDSLEKAGTVVKDIDGIYHVVKV